MSFYKTTRTIERKLFVMAREDRRADQLRPVNIITEFTDTAAGSVLIECGRTRVICTASVEESVPPFLKGQGKGGLPV